MDDLILFDVNGTLIKRDSRTDIPYSSAVDELLGTENAMQGVDTSARSDRDVLLEVLRNHRVPYSEELWARFMELYTGKLDEYRETDVWRPSGDAVPFVKRLHSEGYTLALITGELSIGAEYKLRKIGIWHCFTAGGYGEDGLKRFQIADAALEKVREATGRDYQSRFVIGDTVLDIQTARHLHAVSIAVTTGSHSREKLLSENPHRCVDRFSELEDLFPSAQ